MRLRAFPQIVALAMLAALLIPEPAAAQLTRGGISGIVRDQQGAVVPGATVTVKNLSTGAVRSAVTDVNGLYRVPALEPGLYVVRTELAGFSHTSSVGLPVVVPSTSYWSATVTHPQIPGMTCAIAVATPNSVSAAAGEGEPKCNK